jgi:capsule polysaccharide export protein KpsE/RkpR
MESSVQQLQEIEDSNLQSRAGESSTELPQQETLEWAWLLWMNRRLLARCVVWGFFVSIVLSLLIPSQYESTTKLMPPDTHGDSGSGLAMMAAMASGTSGGGGSAPVVSGSSSLGNIASDLLGMRDPGAVFSDMLKSRTVQDRIIERFDLRKVYGTRYWAAARKKLTKRTAILPDRKSGVITITVTDHNPDRAAQMARAYVEELDRISAQLDTSAAHRERLFIEQRLGEVKQSLDKASHEFSEYSSKNATLDLKDQGVAMVQAAAVLQGQLIAAQSELEGLQQIYTDNNVRIRSLRARVDELQRQLKKVGGSNSGSGDSSQEGEFPSIRKLPLVGARWTDLYREDKIQETVYELLTSQYELAKIDEVKETPVVKVLDVAVVPEKKSFPPRILIVILGTLLAFAGGAGWVRLHARWQGMDPGDPRKQLLQEIAAKSIAFVSRKKARWPVLVKVGSGIRLRRSRVREHVRESQNECGALSTVPREE